MMFCACGNPAETFGGQCDRCASLQMIGLDPKATPQEIESAYHTLVKVWHPDRFLHDPKLRAEAEEKLKEINAAHDYLLDHPAPEAPPSGPRKRPPAPAESSVASASTSDSGGEETKKRRKIPHDHEAKIPALALRAAFALAALAAIALFWLATDSYLSSNTATASYWADLKAQAKQEIATNAQLLPDRASRALQPSSAPSRPEPADAVEDHQPAKTATSQANPQTARPERIRGAQPYVTSGLTPIEVLSVLGKPTSSTGEKMFYHGSEIDFRNGLVAGWKIDPKSSPIRVKLWPDSPPVPGLTTYSVGSSKSDVIALQGTPTLFSDNEFGYENSRVFFQSNRVVGWKEDPSSVHLRVPH